MIPRSTMGRGRSFQRTCLNARYSTTNMSNADIISKGTMLVVISLFIAIENAGSPVTMTPYAGGKPDCSAAISVSRSISILSLSVESPAISTHTIAWVSSGRSMPMSDDRFAMMDRISPWLSGIMCWPVIW